MSTPSQQQLRKKSVQQLQIQLRDLSSNAGSYGLTEQTEADYRALVQRILQQKKKIAQQKMAEETKGPTFSAKLLQRLNAGQASRNRATAQANRIQDFLSRTDVIKNRLRQLQSDAAHLISDLDHLDKELIRIQTANARIQGFLGQAQTERSYKQLLQQPRRT